MVASNRPWSIVVRDASDALSARAPCRLSPLCGSTSDMAKPTKGVDRNDCSWWLCGRHVYLRHTDAENAALGERRGQRDRLFGLAEALLYERGRPITYRQLGAAFSELSRDPRLADDDRGCAEEFAMQMRSFYGHREDFLALIDEDDTGITPDDREQEELFTPKLIFTLEDRPADGLASVHMTVDEEGRTSIRRLDGPPDDPKKRIH